MLEQTTDALRVLDLEPPMGDLFSHVRFGRCQSMWVTPTEEERRAGAPARRIVHAMSFRPHGPVTLRRLGLRSGPGYHKCGSRQDHDWVVDLRVLVFRDGSWHEVRYLQDLPQPVGIDEVRWIDLSGETASGALFEIRRSGIDEWWTPWNLAANAFVLEADPLTAAPQYQRLLDPDADDGSCDRRDGTSGNARGPDALVAGAWTVSGGGLELSLMKSRPAATSFVCHTEDSTAPRESLLATPAGAVHQGLFASPVGASPWVDETVRCAVDGHAGVDDGAVHYDLRLADGAADCRLTWSGDDDGLVLQAETRVAEEVPLWESALWRFTFDTRVSVVSLLGTVTRHGRTGLVRLPAVLHAPRYGSILIESDCPDVLLRWDTDRPANRCVVEVKLAERPGAAGEVVLSAGAHSARITFRRVVPEVSLADDAPTAVRDALRRTLHTAITFRPDTGTLSNNGASIHCPICMDNWAEVTLRAGEVGGGLPASLFLRYSLERWLDGGPGYASGTLRQDDSAHPAEDEYLMTGTAALLGLAQWVATPEGREWAPPWMDRIRDKIREMKTRDLDNDGLIESPYRTGVSGSGQWSTCWLDVLSFGWKDAFSNALLYDALQRLAPSLEALDDRETAAFLTEWAAALKAVYHDTFYNPETGWLAGWRCLEGRLHDYAFPQLNGAAVAAGVVDRETGRSMLERLLAEMERVGVPSAELGLPGNLWNIPDADRADIMYGFPMGYYQNGGRTHAQTRHVLNGLYAVGLTAEADDLLETLCRGLAAGLTFGGNQSGVDWRYWDDRPCGYEGLLTDQFGLLGTALARYGAATT